MSSHVFLNLEHFSSSDKLTTTYNQYLSYDIIYLYPPKYYNARTKYGHINLRCASKSVVKIYVRIKR